MYGSFWIIIAIVLKSSILFFIGVSAGDGDCFSAEIKTYQVTTVVLGVTLSLLALAMIGISSSALKIYKSSSKKGPLEHTPLLVGKWSLGLELETIPLVEDSFVPKTLLGRLVRNIHCDMPICNVDIIRRHEDGFPQNYTDIYFKVYRYSVCGTLLNKLAVLLDIIFLWITIYDEWPIHINFGLLQFWGHTFTKTLIVYI